jgi:competence protein ComEC
MGTVLSLIRILPVVSGPVRDAAIKHKTARIEAVVTSDPMKTQRQDHLNWGSNISSHITVRAEKVTLGRQMIAVRLPVLLFAADQSAVDRMASLVPGMRIEVIGGLSPPRSGSAQAAVLNVRGSLNVLTNPPRYQGLAWQLRQGLHTALRGTSPDAQGLVPGLALGDSSALDSALQDSMQAAGLTHLIAVSGANVTILLMVVLFLIRKFSQRRLVIYGWALAVLIGFVVVVRPQPSVIRAAVMGVIALVAGFTQHRRAALPALAATIIILIAVDPWLAVSFGFALSVVATGALLFWAKQVFAFLDRHTSPRIPMWMLDTLAITICAQVGVFPILVALGSVLSLASIPANMIAVPLATPAMLLGIIAALLTPVMPSVGHVIAVLASFPAQAIAEISRCAAAVTWLQIPWPHGLVGVGLALAAVVVGMHLRMKWVGLETAQQSLALGIVLPLLMLIIREPHVELRVWPPRDWLMVQCDVGQGDGAVIRTGEKQAIVIDAGPDDIAMNRCLSDLHITTISILVLTHFHADHVGGLASVLQHRSVEQIWVSPLFSPPMTAQFVRTTLERADVHAQVLTAGTKLAVGQVQLECLWPSRLIIGQGSDPNNASTVLLVTTHGTTILMTGDVEPAAQDAIHVEHPEVHADVVKIAHHGSRNQSETFAQWLHPKVAFISVGQNNDYGHPAKQTISLYELLGSHVFRTDEQGDLALVQHGQSLAVATRK